MVIKKLNQLESAQKFMQVGVAAKCMHTNFDGCGYSGFRSIATFEFCKFPFQTMDYMNIEGASLAELEHVAIYINNFYINKM